MMTYMSPEARDRSVGTHLSLGRHPTSGAVLTLPHHERYPGLYVIGVQGSGKSGLLETLIHRDAAAGHAIVVFDPHGDLIDHCIAALPAARLPHTYLLNLEDENYPFGANVFMVGTLLTDVARAAAVDRIIHIFEVLWADVLSQQNLPRYVRAAAITLLANPGSTLVDMYRFLLDADVRARLLRNVADPTVRQFWASQYDELSASERARRVQPLLNRLEALFMGRALVRNIVGQKRSTISFRRAIERREIVFIKLPLKTLEQDARLIGTILLSQLSAAVFSFGDLPEAERPGVSLYVDEAQNFSTPDFAALFSEGRKFGIRMTLAHQYRGQLPDYLRQSTMTARTKVVFAVTPDDGRELAHLFPDAGSSLEITPKPVTHLLTYGHDDPAINHFLSYYLRPLKGNRQLLKVTDTTLTVGRAIGAFFGSPGLTEPERVTDPLYALNTLLYDVMQTRVGRVPIPRAIATGFSGCGAHPFLYAARKAHDEYQPDYRFPAWIVKRDPEDGAEQLLHFLLSLRLVMDRLAAQPIGQRKETRATDVGRMLTQLPKRAAFVRSGETAGVIYTEDTPPQLTGPALQQRIDMVQDQTRRKYGHPREDVESSFTAEEPTSTGTAEPLTSDPPTPPETPTETEHSRWDDLEDY